MLCYNQRTVVVSDVVSQWCHGEKQRELMLHGGDIVSLWDADLTESWVDYKACRPADKHACRPGWRAVMHVHIFVGLERHLFAHSFFPGKNPTNHFNHPFVFGCITVNAAHTIILINQTVCRFVCFFFFLFCFFLIIYCVYVKPQSGYITRS